MGMDERLLAQSYDEAGRLFAHVRRRQFAPCDEGRMLTEALMDAARYFVPGTLLDGLPVAITRHLVGPEVADLLGLPQSNWTDLVRGALRWVISHMSEEGDDSRVIGYLIQLFSRKLVEGVGWASRGGERVPFSIPDVLRAQWQMAPGPTAR
jgi:hypothetical protein